MRILHAMAAASLVLTPATVFAQMGSSPGDQSGVGANPGMGTSAPNSGMGGMGQDGMQPTTSGSGDATTGGMSSSGSSMAHKSHHPKSAMSHKKTSPADGSQPQSPASSMPH